MENSQYIYISIEQVVYNREPMISLLIISDKFRARDWSVQLAVKTIGAWIITPKLRSKGR